MGLTIHWDIKYGGKNPAEILEKLRQAAKDLPFEEVHDLRHFEGEDCDYEKWRGKDESATWALIQAGTFVDLGGGASTSVQPVELWNLSTWPGPGSEAANISLARYPATIEHRGKTFKTKKGRGWTGGSFCKTHYAVRAGLGNFLRCHMSVVALLDKAKALGLKVEVSDEGDFWEKRDVKALAREIGGQDSMIKAFAKALTGVAVAAGSGHEVVTQPDRIDVPLDDFGKLSAFLAGLPPEAKPHTEPQEDEED